jgi:ATP adenylyltransferase
MTDNMISHVEGALMAKCTICDELKLGVGRKAWNEPLIETGNFVVLPSLGALVDGWVLVVPKEHRISMGALPVELRGEAEEITRRARLLLRRQYRKPIVAFEHGPSVENHGTGCGVDHAHLHLLPLGCDLFAYVRPFVPAGQQWRACDWEDLSKAHAQGLDYLFLQSEARQPLMAVAHDFGSQVFRKAVASFLRMESEFSWREYPRVETVARTIGTLNEALANQPIGESEHVA